MLTSSGNPQRFMYVHLPWSAFRGVSHGLFVLHGDISAVLCTLINQQLFHWWRHRQKILELLWGLFLVDPWSLYMYIARLWRCVHCEDTCTGPDAHVWQLHWQVTSYKLVWIHSRLNWVDKTFFAVKSNISFTFCLFLSRVIIPRQRPITASWIGTVSSFRSVTSKFTGAAAMAGCTDWPHSLAYGCGSMLAALSAAPSWFSLCRFSSRCWSMLCNNPLRSKF